MWIYAIICTAAFQSSSCAIYLSSRNLPIQKILQILVFRFVCQVLLNWWSSGFLCFVGSWICSDISEEQAASIFMWLNVVQAHAEVSFSHQSLQHPTEPNSVILNMVARRSFDMSEQAYHNMWHMYLEVLHVNTANKCVCIFSLMNIGQILIFLPWTLGNIPLTFKTVFHLHSYITLQETDLSGNSISW
jgi:hypothetical protein